MNLYQDLKNFLSFYFPRIYSLADKNKKLVKFGLVGIVATAINLISLYLFTDILGIWYLLSAVLAFIIAFTVSFSFQKLWTFRDRSTHKITSQAFFYFVVTFISLILNLWGLYVMVDILGIYYLLSQLIVGVALALLRFAIIDLLIFNVKNETQGK